MEYQATEIIFFITEFLSIYEAVRLSSTCKQLRWVITQERRVFSYFAMEAEFKKYSNEHAFVKIGSVAYDAASKCDFVTLRYIRDRAMVWDQIIFTAACINGKIETVKWLIENDLKPSLDIYDGLFNAAKSGNIELVTYLDKMCHERAYKKNEIRERAYFKILEGAMASQNIKLIKYAIHRDGYFIDINEALRLAILSSNKESIELVLSEDGIDYEQGLYAAAEVGNREFVDFFISKGAHDFAEALTSACLSGDIEMVKFFIRKDAKLTWPCLSQGIKTRDTEFLKQLISLWEFPHNPSIKSFEFFLLSTVGHHCWEEGMQLIIEQFSGYYSLSSELWEVLAMAAKAASNDILGKCLSEQAAVAEVRSYTGDFPSMVFNSSIESQRKKQRKF